MKFLCIECDERMDFEDREVPGDGTFGASFKCPKCGRRIAMLANPMESQLMEALGVEIGGRTLDAEPMQFVEKAMVTRDDAIAKPSGVRTVWSEAGKERLERVPTFVRGMVKRIYTDWALEHGIEQITPEIMDRARTELGLEGM